MPLNPQSNHLFPYRDPARKEGLTLVEVMVALTLLALMFAGISGGLIQGNHFVSMTRSSQYANQLLQDQVEAMRAMPWHTLEGLPEQEQYDVADPGVAGNSTPYRVMRVISDRKLNQKEVRLTISWRDGRGVDHDISSVAWFTKGGLNEYYLRSH